jgi:hypothetical protein
MCKTAQTGLGLSYAVGKLVDHTITPLCCGYLVADVLTYLPIQVN